MSAIVAKYDYDPYGNNRLDPNDPNESGPLAAVNRFRFSTKYFDVETGLSYFGGRYYHAALGRWLNRDPIGELGGVNLYAFAGNDPIDHIDPLGHAVCLRGKHDCFHGYADDDNGGGRCPRRPPAPDHSHIKRRKPPADTQPTTQPAPPGPLPPLPPSKTQGPNNRDDGNLPVDYEELQHFVCSANYNDCTEDAQGRFQKWIDNKMSNANINDPVRVKARNECLKEGKKGRDLPQCTFNKLSDIYREEIYTDDWQDCMDNYLRCMGYPVPRSDAY